MSKREKKICIFTTKKKRNDNYDITEVLTNAMVVIMLQSIHISNQYILHLKLTQCISVISQGK